MFVTITQNKKELCVKVPTDMFPIKSASDIVIYPSDRLAKYNSITLGLMLDHIQVDGDEVTATFINPHGRVQSLLESLTGSLTFRYLDLSLKAKVIVKLKSMKIKIQYTRVDRRLIVTFTKFKHTSEEGNYAIM